MARMAVAAAVAVLLVWAPAAGAVFPGQDGRLVVAKGSGSDRDLFIYNPDGSGETPLLEGASNPSRPSMSGDGQAVVYSDGGDIWRMPLGGGAPMQLTNGAAADLAPTWTIDGRVWFLRDARAWSMLPDGRDQRQELTDAAEELALAGAPPVSMGGGCPGSDPLLAYVRQEGPAFEVVVRRCDGSPMPVGAVGNLAFAPNGDLLVSAEDLNVCTVASAYSSCTQPYSADCDAQRCLEGRLSASGGRLYAKQTENGIQTLRACDADPPSDCSFGTVIASGPFVSFDAGCGPCTGFEATGGGGGGTAPPPPPPAPGYDLDVTVEPVTQRETVDFQSWFGWQNLRPDDRKSNWKGGRFRITVTNLPAASKPSPDRLAMTIFGADHPPLAFGSTSGCVGRVASLGILECNSAPFVRGSDCTGSLCLIPSLAPGESYRVAGHWEIGASRASPAAQAAAAGPATIQVDLACNPAEEASCENNVLRPPATINFLNGGDSGIDSKALGRILDEIRGTASPPPPSPRRSIRAAAARPRIAHVEIALLRVEGRLKGFSGQARAAARRAKARCAWLASPKGRLQRTRPAGRTCNAPVWLRARGTRRWRYKLRRPLRPGSYVVYSRAVTNEGATEEYFSGRDRNRAAFKVQRRRR